MLQLNDIILILNRSLRQTAILRKNTDAVYFCPKCNHRKRKLEINIITGKYNCWVCEFSGLSFFSFFKKLNISTEDSRKLIGVVVKPKIEDLNDFKLYPTEEIPKDLNLPQEFISLASPNLNSSESVNAKFYLKRRNISQFDILKYNIGYCEIGEYKGRIVFPSYDAEGNLNFFAARSYYDNAFLKYKLCDWSKNIIGNELFVNFNEELTLVEGNFDAIAIRDNAIPLFGTTLSPALKFALINNKIKRLNIVLDNDAIRKSIQICEFALTYDIPTFLVRIKEKDPAVLGFEKVWEIINNTKQITLQDLLHLKINLW